MAKNILLNLEIKGIIDGLKALRLRINRRYVADQEIGTALWGI